MTYFLMVILTLSTWVGYFHHNVKSSQAELDSLSIENEKLLICERSLIYSLEKEMMLRDENELIFSEIRERISQSSLVNSIFNEKKQYYALLDQRNEEWKKLLESENEFENLLRNTDLKRIKKQGTEIVKNNEKLEEKLDEITGLQNYSRIFDLNEEELKGKIQELRFKNQNIFKNSDYAKNEVRMADVDLGLLKAQEIKTHLFKTANNEELQRMFQSDILCGRNHLEEFLREETMAKKVHGDVALMRFEKILRDYPQMMKTAEILFYKGNTALLLNQDDLAFDSFDRLVSEYPTSVFVNFAKVKQLEYFFEKSRFENVISVFNEIKNIENDKLLTTKMLNQSKLLAGLSYYQLNEPDIAIKFLEDIPGSFKGFFTARLILSTCYVSLGKLDDAVDVLKSLKRRVPQSIEGENLVSKICLNLGYLLFEQGKFTDALEEFQEIPESSELFDNAGIGIGFCRLKRGELDRAEKILLMVYKKQGSTITGVRALFALGDIYTSKQKFESAKFYYSKVIESVKDLRSGIEASFAEKLKQEQAYVDNLKSDLEKLEALVQEDGDRLSSHETMAQRISLGDIEKRLSNARSHVSEFWVTDEKNLIDSYEFKAKLKLADMSLAKKMLIEQKIVDMTTRGAHKE